MLHSSLALHAYSLLAMLHSRLFVHACGHAFMTQKSSTRVDLPTGLHCRFIQAAEEINYAYKVLQLDGATLEATNYWQYVMKNGKDSLYRAYAVSLDLYVLFCWSQLGGLANLLTGLLVAEVSPAACVICWLHARTPSTSLP
jgi:hypothetical protein